MLAPSSREECELERGECSLGIGMCERVWERERNVATRKERRREEELRHGRERERERGACVRRVWERGRELLPSSSRVAIKHGASCSLHLCEPKNKRAREEHAFERWRPWERELEQERKKERKERIRREGSLPRPNCEKSWRKRREKDKRTGKKKRRKEEGLFSLLPSQPMRERERGERKQN
jgi:hypothetical protein